MANPEPELNRKTGFGILGVRCLQTRRGHRNLLFEPRDLGFVHGQLARCLLASLADGLEVEFELLNTALIELNGFFAACDIGTDLIEGALYRVELTRFFAVCNASLFKLQVDARLHRTRRIVVGFELAQLTVVARQLRMHCTQAQGVQLGAAASFVSLQLAILFRRPGLPLQVR